jgi:hypothetical protein
MALVWLVFLPVPLELYHGNIHFLIASACVLGFEYPAAWSFLLISKVTPGVALLWFAVRREWRSLAIAIGAAAAICAVSFLIAPGAWWDWANYLRDSQSNGAANNYLFEPLLPPLWIRIGLAALVVVWGARTDRRWAVPVALVIAMPVIWTTTPAVLVAIPRLRGKFPRAAKADAATEPAAPIASAANPPTPPAATA